MSLSKYWSLWNIIGLQWVILLWTLNSRYTGYFTIQIHRKKSRYISWCLYLSWRCTSGMHFQLKYSHQSTSWSGSSQNFCEKIHFFMQYLMCVDSTHYNIFVVWVRQSHMTAFLQYSCKNSRETCYWLYCELCSLNKIQFYRK